MKSKLAIALIASSFVSTAFAGTIENTAPCLIRADEPRFVRYLNANLVRSINIDLENPTVVRIHDVTLPNQPLQIKYSSPEEARRKLDQFAQEMNACGAKR